MDAFGEAIGAAVGAFFEMMIALIEVTVTLLAALFEFLYVVLTKGFPAAKVQFRERRESPRSPVAGVVGAVILLGMLVFSVSLIVQQHREQERIAQTRVQLETLSGQILRQERPLPATGQLPERDAWDRPLESHVKESTLFTSVAIRSAGPDRSMYTADDLQNSCQIRIDLQQAAGQLAEKGLDKLEDRAAGLFRRESRGVDDAQ